MDWFIYSVLSEKRKQALSGLLTDQQKNFLKRLLQFGTNYEQMRMLNQLKYHLYNLGFTDRPLEDLNRLLMETKQQPFLRKIAFELALWHANLYTKEDAKRSLDYLKRAKTDELNLDQLRRIAILEAESYELLEQFDKGRAVLEQALKRGSHPDLYLARANLEEDISERMDWINRAFSLYDLSPIAFRTKEGKITYDDLQMQGSGKKITEGPLVSIVLPAYNAENGIRIAIESILEQTWQNMELLIVDDCSTDNTVSVIKQYITKDDRVKFFQTPTNSGPYIARNIGLMHARGEFFTVNDADDWSHAEKIEIQVKHLIDHPEIIANTSEHARLSEDLKFYRRGNPGRYIFPNMSSLMFRREVVLEKLGYWDSVRFAGDGEFKRRLLKTFGESSFVDLNTGPLSLPRQSRQSLTGSSSFGYNGFFMGARKTYVEMLEHYHKRAESLYYPYPLKRRFFSVPEPMKPDRSINPEDVRSLPLVICADFRLILEDEPNFLEKLAQWKEKYETVGFIQWSKYALQAEPTIPEEILEQIDGEKVQWVVYGEHIRVKKCILLDHLILEDEQRYLPKVQAEEAYVWMYKIPESMEKVHQQIQRNAKKHFGSIVQYVPVDKKVRERLDKEEPQISSDSDL